MDNKVEFRKGVREKELAPPRLSGDEVWQRICDYPRIIDQPSLVVTSERLDGYGVRHNWTKRSIFWDLPYWRSHLIRHNLDVMHIEKNVFENIFNTVMDIKDKTKDNIKARLDLELYCSRSELALRQHSTGNTVKPKAKYTLTREQKKDVCDWVKQLRFPDGYASNLRNCVDLSTCRLSGMKSHDCHIFMERLLPVAFTELPEAILKPLAELSKFFRDLCSTELRVGDLRQMQLNIPTILCSLEKIFPPGFFDSMEHLTVHLPYEAIVAGPVEYRWMYLFERFVVIINYSKYILYLIFSYLLINSY
jgi:hypothetical protein